jgi:hypothetical protein
MYQESIEHVLGHMNLVQQLLKSPIVGQFKSKNVRTVFLVTVTSWVCCAEAKNVCASIIYVSCYSVCNWRLCNMLHWIDCDTFSLLP